MHPLFSPWPSDAEEIESHSIPPITPSTRGILLFSEGMASKAKSQAKPFELLNVTWGRRVHWRKHCWRVPMSQEYSQSTARSKPRAVFQYSQRGSIASTT